MIPAISIFIGMIIQSSIIGPLCYFLGKKHAAEELLSPLRELQRLNKQQRLMVEYCEECGKEKPDTKKLNDLYLQIEEIKKGA